MQVIFYEESAMFESWLNPPIDWKQNDECIVISAAGNSDFFVDPVTGAISNNAPFYARKIQSDFVLSCKVKPDFIGNYDAGSLLIYQDEEHWAKLAFENTDLGYTSVVSVVTDGVSDDANGEVVNQDYVWLKMARVGDVLAFYYSLDNCFWRLVRIFKFKFSDSTDILAGIMAQSPVGDGCVAEFSEVCYDNSLISDLRKGI